MDNRDQGRPSKPTGTIVRPFERPGNNHAKISILRPEGEREMIAAGP